MPKRRQGALPSLVALRLERLFRGGQRPEGLVVGIDQRKSPRSFLAVGLNPKLIIIAIVAEVETGDSPIAGITGGRKLGPMKSAIGTKWIGAGLDSLAGGLSSPFKAIHGATLA